MRHRVAIIGTGIGAAHRKGHLANPDRTVAHAAPMHVTMAAPRRGRGDDLRA